MITRGQARSFSAFRLLLLAALMPSGLACLGVGQGDGSIHGGEDRMVEAQIRLPDAEQMIDDLDRMLTANGTIGVKSPDVWGQDRLAKFRSEYETQLSEWLKTGFKGDINASSCAVRPKRIACPWEQLPRTPRCKRRLSVIRRPPPVPHPNQPQARARARQHPIVRRTGRRWPSSRRSFLMSTRIISITSINYAGSTRETILRIGRVTDCTWSEFLSLCRRGREAGAVKGRSSRCLRSR